MTQLKIAVLVGSLRKDSSNRKLAEALIRLAPAELSFFFVDLKELPLYNQDDETSPSAQVTAFREALKPANGFLFVTPEYNRSIPGVLKNALDIGSRPYGQSVWGGKPAGIVGVSSGVLGSSMAQQHLRNILSFLDVPTLSQPEVYLQYKEGLIDEQGNINETSRAFLQSWMDKFSAWVKKFNS
ncbi:MAG: NAD(P)H-dependent oxidoreductase [Anaerolineaceae bacterium]|nr:NAD(P)H-dependent oxidoreductase [Anaerolineaceae bacterium]